MTDEWYGLSWNYQSSQFICHRLIVSLFAVCRVNAALEMNVNRLTIDLYSMFNVQHTAISSENKPTIFTTWFYLNCQWNKVKRYQVMLYICFRYFYLLHLCVITGPVDIQLQRWHEQNWHSDTLVRRETLRHSLSKVHLLHVEIEVYPE